MTARPSAKDGPTAPATERSTPVSPSTTPLADGRCFCSRCTSRTEDIYRMVGHCTNCATKPILILYRAGDKASDQDCPVCGCDNTVTAYRLATDDEIPAEVTS